VVNINATDTDANYLREMIGFAARRRIGDVCELH
jgi:hypothetical protein